MTATRTRRAAGATSAARRVAAWRALVDRVASRVLVDRVAALQVFVDRVVWRIAARRVAAWRVVVGLIVIGLAGGALVAGSAHAYAEPAPQGDAVALLPLDTDRSLEIYGQPVARAIARALEDGKVQVVVVGAKMAVPERARLIIDGTIATGKASTVTISLRIRNTVDGKVIETLSATAPGLAKLDVTAAELSARALPIVRDRLAALAPPADDHARIPSTRSPARPPTGTPDATAPAKIVALAVVDQTRGSSGAALYVALDAAATAWTRAHHREPRKLDVSKLDPRLVTKAVTASEAELAVGFWILGYSTERGAVPMARARVRVQIADASAVVFDRVVVTDTVLGDKSSSATDLATRVAREVLAILRPHLRRQVPSWW
jgi:hypothetical protein